MVYFTNLSLLYVKSKLTINFIENTITFYAIYPFIYEDILGFTLKY